MTCAQGLLRLLWGGPKLECYGTAPNQRNVFIMKCTTLSHFEPTQVYSAIQKNAVYHGIKMQFIMEYTTLLHVDPSQVQDPNKKNAIYPELRDVIAYLL